MQCPGHTETGGFWLYRGSIVQGFPGSREWAGHGFRPRRGLEGPNEPKSGPTMEFSFLRRPLPSGLPALCLLLPALQCPLVAIASHGNRIAPSLLPEPQDPSEVGRKRTFLLLPSARRLRDPQNTMEALGEIPGFSSRPANG